MDLFSTHRIDTLMFFGHFGTSYSHLQSFFIEFLKVKHFAYFNFLQKYEIF